MRTYSVSAATPITRMRSEAATAGFDRRSRRGREPTFALERLAQSQVETEPVEERALGSEVRSEPDQCVGLREVQGAAARGVRVVGEVDPDRADGGADARAHSGRDAPVLRSQVRDVSVLERAGVHEPRETDPVGGERGGRAQLEVDDREGGPADRAERDVVEGNQRVGRQRIDLDRGRDVDPRAESVAREATHRGCSPREEAVLGGQEVAVRDE